MSAVGWRLAAAIADGTALDEVTQRIRLAQYCRTHPGVVITEDPEFGGTWQGRHIAGATEAVVIRYRLRDLLDKLEEREEDFPPGRQDGGNGPDG